MRCIIWLCYLRSRRWQVEVEADLSLGSWPSRSSHAGRGLSRGWVGATSPFSGARRNRLHKKNGPILLKWKLYSIGVDPSSLWNGLSTLMVSRGTNLWRWIQSLPNSKWHTVWESITWNPSAVFIGPTIKSKFMKSRVYVELPVEPNASIDCFIILPQGTPTTSRMDKEMMFNEDPRSIVAFFSSTPWILAVTYDGRFWWLGMSFWSFSWNTTTLSSNLLPPRGLLSTRHEPPDGSDSSMMAYQSLLWVKIYPSTKVFAFKEFCTCWAILSRSG